MTLDRPILTPLRVVLGILTAAACLAGVDTVAAGPSSEWSVQRSSDGGVVTRLLPLGPGDVATPGDYDGDGTANFAVFRSAARSWFIEMGTGVLGPIPFGSAGDIPVPADYDGDGRTDLGVYQQSTGRWFLLGSTAGPVGPVPFGAPGLHLLPAPADYDGDGKADLGIYDKSTGRWFLLQSSAGFTGAISFGAPGLELLPAPADYDGDGRADLGLFLRSAGQWFFLGSSIGFQGPVSFGQPFDLPVPADYDGDGRADVAVFRHTGAEVCQQRAVVHCDLGTYSEAYFQVLPQFVAVRGFVQFDMSGFVVEGLAQRHTFLHVSDALALAGDNWFFVRALDTIVGRPVGGWKIKSEAQGIAHEGSYEGGHVFDRNRTYRVRAEWDPASIRVFVEGHLYTHLELPRAILINGLHLWINHTPRSPFDPPYPGAIISNVVVGGE